MIGIPAAVALVLVGGVLGARWVVYNRSHVSTDDAQVEASIYPVSPRVSGHVLDVLFDENREVKAGQLLVVIDPRDYRVALQQAQAAVEQAQAAASAAAGTVRVTERTGSAGISQASAEVAGARASQAVAERQSDSAASQVETARAEKAAASAAVEAARRQADAAEAALTSARAKADEADKDAARMEQLLQSGAVSVQQRDAAVAAKTSARANVESAQAQVRASRALAQQAQERERQAVLAVRQAIQRAAAARAQVAEARAGIGRAEAALQSAHSSPIQTGVRRSEARNAIGRLAEARARLKQATLNLSYTRIVAPVDGVVAKKNVEPGQYVQPGQPLAAIVASGSTHITANFKETQLGAIRVGQRATFTVDAYPGITFRGRVESVSPGTGAVFSLLPPENASGNFTRVVQRVPVRIAIDSSDDPNHPMRAGMSAVVTVDTR